MQRASAIIFMLAPLGALVLSGALIVPAYVLAEFPRVFVRHVLLLFVLAGVCSLLLASLGWRLRKILGPVRRSAYAGSRADRAADALSSLDRARGVRLWCAWETFFAAVTLQRLPRALVATPFLALCVACALGVWRRDAQALRVSAARFFFAVPCAFLLGPLNPFVGGDMRDSSPFFVGCYVSFWGVQLVLLPWLGWALGQTAIELARARHDLRDVARSPRGALYSSTAVF